MNLPTKIILHHTGGTSQDPNADTSHHTFEIVDAYHKSLGWGKIGYHYFIEKDGKTTQGRGDKEEGAHTLGQNRTSLGICLAGNFDTYIPTTVQVEALKRLLKEKCVQYSIPSSQVLPHRAFASKSCYGKKLSNTWGAELLGDRSVLALKLQIQILNLKLQIARLLGN